MIVVTGAGGFIGRHLTRELVSRKVAPVRCLVRKRDGSVAPEGVEIVEGDVASEAAWRSLLVPGCTVINLAQANEWSTSEAVLAMRKSAEVCADAGIKRFVHCSTVSVYGRVQPIRLRESDACNPTNDYGRLKLSIEQVLSERAAGRFQLVNLRPTSVFGDGGTTLMALVGQLTQGTAATNYVRSCLFGRRAMHLVPVETVVAALLFLTTSDGFTDQETFIVSDDDEPGNDFRSVEQTLIEELNAPRHPIPLVNLPPLLLEALLRLRGRRNTNTRRVFDGAKLRAAGFRHPVPLEVALRRFARQCRAKLQVAGKLA